MLTEHRISALGGKKPQQVVMFLHGYGDSGSGGLLSIGEIWQRHLPDCEFLCPDAPHPLELAPPDFGGRQWFSLQSRAPEAVAAGTRQAAPLLNDYIDHVLASRQLPANRLALVGFSQGTMMSLYVAPRRAQPVACVVGYSGMLTGGDTLAVEKKSTMPILLVHGTADDVVSYTALGMAEQALKAADFPVTTLSCPGVGHSIDDAGITEGLRFIKKSFGI